MATYCEPCKIEHEDLKSALDGRDFVVLSISIYSLDTDAKLRDYRDEYEIPWQMVGDPAGVLRAQYGVVALPRMVIVDQGGIIYATHTGLISLGDLIEELDDAGV